jgi:hypothetical protein
MKTEIIRIKKHLSAFFISLTIFLVFSLVCEAQKEKEISFSVYPGHTFINFEEAYDYSDDHMEDWDEFHIAVALRGFLGTNNLIQVGLEVAWQQLYYVYYRIPYYEMQYLYREYDISTISLSLLLRYSRSSFFAIAGPGIHFFDGHSALSLFTEAGFFINVGDKFRIPVSLKLSPIFTDGEPSPLSVGIGISLQLK